MIVSIDITPTMSLVEYVKVAKRAYLVSVLQRASGNVAQAARTTGLNRTHLHEMISDFGLLDYARGLRLAVVDLRHARTEAGQSEPAAAAR